MKKYVLSLIVLIVMMSQVSFAEPSSWAVEFIDYAQENNIVTERLLKDYQNYITREEFSEMIILLYEKISNKKAVLPSVNPFTDTQNQSVLKANELGIVGGKGNGVFAPNALITRQEIAVIYDRMLKVVSVPIEVTEAYQYFSDENLISDWAKSSVQKLNKLNILGGVGANRINPLGNSTREQAITLTARTFENILTMNKDPQGSLGSQKALTSEQVGKLSSGVVKIYVEDIDGNLSTGSGFFYDANKIGTNFHVIENAKKIEVEFEDGSWYRGDVKVLGYDSELDLAVIKVDKSAPLVLDLGDSSKIIKGQSIYTIGSPIGLMNTLSNGIISSVRDQIIQITAPISHGSSGGVLLDEYGQVIGITSSGIVEGENLGFAIPINLFKSMTKNQSLTLTEFVSKSTIKPEKVSYLTASVINSNESYLVWQDTGADEYYLYDSINNGEWNLISNNDGGYAFNSSSSKGLYISGYQAGQKVAYAIYAVKNGVDSDFTYSNEITFSSSISTDVDLESFLTENYSILTLNQTQINIDNYSVSAIGESKAYIYAYINVNDFLIYSDSEYSNQTKLALDTKNYANQFKNIVGKEVVFTIIYSDYYSFYPSGFINNYIYDKTVEYSSLYDKWFLFYPLIEVETGFSYYRNWYSMYSY